MDDRDNPQSALVLMLVISALTACLCIGAMVTAVLLVGV